MRINEENDRFSDIDESDEDDDMEMTDPELSGLISQLQGSDDVCEVSDVVSAEDHLPTCAEFADDTWNKQFMSELRPADKVMCPDDDSVEATDDDEDETTPIEMPHLKA